MMSISVRLTLALLCLIFIGHEGGAGEKLVYAISYKGADYTVVKTEIFAIDPETSEKQVIFTDEKSAIVLIEKPYVFHFPVVGGGKLFAHAAERGQPVPYPGNDALYELTVDRSNRFRKICPVLGGESLGNIFVNTSGNRIGYFNRIKGKQYIFIHDVATGALLYQIDITDKFLDCYASGIGWLPQSKQLFFSLETGCEDATSEASYTRVGTYFMNEDGRQLKRLPKIPAIKGFPPPETALMIGVLPTGDYLFETMQYSEKHSPEQTNYYYTVSKVKGDFSKAEEIGFSPSAKVYSGVKVTYRLSPSGLYLSAARLPVPSSANSSNVWLKNLDTGSERAILQLPTDGFTGPFLGLVGWLE